MLRIIRDLLEKYPALLFCENLMDSNEARLYEETLNLYTHAWSFSRLSIASDDGKHHMSEIVFSALVGLSLYTTSTHHSVKQSPKSTKGMSSVAYMMLCGARDRTWGQRVTGTSIKTMPQHIPRTWFRLFSGEKPDSCGSPDSLLFWYSCSRSKVRYSKLYHLRPQKTNFQMKSKKNI